MRAWRFVGATLIVLLVCLATPAIAATATDAFGRAYAGQAACLACHDGLLASDRTGYVSTAHGQMVIDVRANPAALVPLASSTTLWPSPGFGSQGLRFGPSNVYLLVGGGPEKDFVGIPGEALPALSPIANVPVASGAPADDLTLFNGATWNTETGTWTGTSAVSARGYLQSCGACHNTGVTRPSADTFTLASGATISPSTPTSITGISIQCEVCHGTGSSTTLHELQTPQVLAWTSSAGAPGRLMSAEVCGQCHVDGTTTERNYAGTGKFSSPNGYSADETLTAYYTPSSTVPTEGQFLASPATYKFYPNGANRSMRHPVYNEWLQNKAANGFGHVSPSNNPSKRDAKCLRCHSGEGFLERIGDPIVPAAFNVSATNVKWGITCQVCHAPHDVLNGLGLRTSTDPSIGTVDCGDCHNWQFEVLEQVIPTEEAFAVDGLAGQRVRHPQREMNAGVGLMGVPEGGEFMPGVECAGCHMPQTWTGGEGRPSHRFHVMLPGKAEEWGVREGGDSCTPCHPSTSREDLQLAIDGWQDETQALLDEVTAAMTAARARVGWTDSETSYIATSSLDPDVVAYKKAFHNRDYVANDASVGAHNPPYAQVGLRYSLAVARSIGGSVTLSGPPAGGAGTDVTVVGTAAMGDGSTDAGERVELQARKVGELEFVTVALADTNALGAYSAAYRLTAATELRAVWKSAGGDRTSPVIEIAIGSYGGLTPVDRASGADRYATAVEGSKSFFTSGSVSNVVLASGASFADALSANGLAGVAASPLLLTAPTALPAVTLAEIDRVSQEPAVTTVWIVGGENAVGPAVADALDAAGYQVKRLAGADRYHTARLVAAQVVAALGDLYTGDAFLANGRVFADGLSVGPAAYANGIPVLLTETDAVPAGTTQAIADAGVSRALVVGGSAAVSDAVLAVLPAGSMRVAAGADRYGTAVAFAAWARAQGLASYGMVGIASGAVFPDALSAGGPIGASGGVLLLTRPDSLPDGVNAFLVDHEAEIGHLMIFGGTAAVSDTVRSAIYDCLND